jgi:hypothetical protein
MSIRPKYGDPTDLAVDCVPSGETNATLDLLTAPDNVR